MNTDLHAEEESNKDGISGAGVLRINPTCTCYCDVRRKKAADRQSWHLSVCGRFTNMESFHVFWLLAGS